MNNYVPRALLRTYVAAEKENKRYRKRKLIIKNNKNNINMINNYREQGTVHTSVDRIPNHQQKVL